MFEWAWRRASKRSGGGVGGRRTKLREVLNRERWTARSPLAADVPLTLHWLPLPDDGSGSKLLLGPPLRAEVTEVLEPANGVDAWAAVAQPTATQRAAAMDQRNSDEREDIDEDEDENENRNARQNVMSLVSVATPVGASNQHYASAWLDAEAEWASLEAGLDAPTHAQTRQNDPVPSAARCEVESSLVELNQMKLPVAAIDLTGGTTDSSDGDDDATADTPRSAVIHRKRRRPMSLHGACLKSSSQKGTQEKTSNQKRRRPLSLDFCAGCGEADRDRNAAPGGG